MQEKRKCNEGIGTYTRPFYSGPITARHLRRLTPHRRAARRLGWDLVRRRLRDRARYRFVGCERDVGAVVRDLERSALEQGVAGLPVVYLYTDTAPLEAAP